MPSKVETEEIKHYARQELRPEIERLQDLEVAHRQTADAVAAVARAVERLSIVAMGDEKLGVKGLVVDMAEVKLTAQQTLIDKAKTAGIWIGASTLGIGLVRVLWEVITNFFSK